VRFVFGRCSTEAPLRLPVCGSGVIGIVAPMPEQIDAAELANELRLALRGVTRGWRSAYTIPLAHTSVLVRLDREGSTYVSALATAEHVRPQSMAQTIAELEGQGFVHKRDDPEDGRRLLIEITPEGRRRLEQDRRRRQDWLSEAMDHELSDAERATIAGAIPLLRRLGELKRSPESE
jgi:DNA-binding MarR family transcriptional regulator